MTPPGIPTCRGGGAGSVGGGAGAGGVAGGGSVVVVVVVVWAGPESAPAASANAAEKPTRAQAASKPTTIARTPSFMSSV